MKEGVGSQKSGVRMPRKWTVNSGQWIAKRLLQPGLLLFTVHCALSTALSATHVTATYDLGANPRVMATVNGTPQYGLVFAQRNKLVTYGDVEYGPSVVKAYLNTSGQLNDGAGNLWLDLIPNLGATPGDSYYVLTLNIQGRVHAEIWVVPDVASVSAEVCRQAQPPSSTSPALFYQFLQQDGDDLPQRQKLNFSGSGVNCVDNAGQLRTDCTVSGGGGSVPKASATSSGTVKTDTTESDPVVYLKSSADSLLAAKAPLAHGHAESDVTNLVTDLAGKVASTRAVNTTAPLSGGGALSSDLTLSLPAASGSQNGYLTSANWTTFNSKESALSFNAPLNRSVNTISIPQASGSQNGYLASGDWTTFNNKVSTSRSISTTAPLLGGGNLSADRTLSIDLFGTSPGTKVVSTSLAGDPSADNCVKWLAGGKLGDAGAACGSGGGAHNLFSATHSDTVATTPVLGDIPYANSTPAWTKLAGNTTTTKKWLNQTGNGSVSAAPRWDAIADGDLPNTIVRTSRNVSTSSPLGGGGTLASDLTLTCPTCEVTGNKNAANGYAGLTASTKLNVAQGQEVWGLSDLSNVSGTSGSGSTAILSTLTGLAANDLLKWSGSNWVNTSFIPESQVTNLTTDLAGKVPTSRNLNTSSPLAGGGALSSDLTLTCTTCELTGNKNAASGYAGLTSGTKLTAAQGQEVWGVSDLTDYATKSGTGTAAVAATFTSLTTNDVVTWNGSNWINQAPSGGSAFSAITTGTNTAATMTVGNGATLNGAAGGIVNLSALTPTTGFKVPVGAGAAPLTSGLLAYDSTANEFKVGVNGATKTLARADGNITGTAAGLSATLGLATGGTNQTSWTSSRCVQVNSGGTALESAAAACGSGGSGDNISVNGTAATDADFDDSTPAAPANAINVKWQKDASTPTNISAYWLSTAVGVTIFGSGSAFTWSFDDDAATSPSIGFSAGGITLTATGTNQNVTLTPSGTGVGKVASNTIETQNNKNAASGYAGLTAGTKLTASQGQEVWGVSDLTDYSTTSGSGSTALKATITSPSSNDVLTWNGSNWINQAASGGSNHNLLSSTHADSDAGSAVLGDIISVNSTPHWQRVAGNTTGTKKFLTQTGTGSASALPAWGTIADADIPNTIARTASPTLTGTVTVNGVVNQSTSNSGTGDLIGVMTAATSTHTSGSQETVVGVSGNAAHDGAGGATTTLAGVGGYAEIDAGTASNLMSLVAYSNGSYGGTATNNYGLFVQAQTAGTTNYAIFTQGTAPSKFGGAVDAVGGFKVNSAATNHSVLLGNGTIFQGSGAIPDCQDAGGNHLNYTQSSQAFSCGTTGGSGGGDSISVNGSAAADADFDDSTPAAPANTINVKWQKDASTPNSLSAYVPYASPLTVASGNLTVGNDSIGPTQIDETASYSFSGTLGTPVKADPGSPTVGEIWVNQWALRYRDNSGTPVTRTAEVMSNKNVASGYAGLTASTKLNASQGQEVWAFTDLSDVAISSPSTGQVPRYDGSGWVNSALACTDVTNCPSLVAAGSAGISAYNAGAAATAARSDHTHRVIRTMQWYFPGTVVAGVQTARSLVPEGVSNCALTNSRLTAGTVGGTATAWNIQRCTTAAGDCTATADIYSGNITLNASTQSVAGGTPNTTTATAGDAFRVNLASVGTNLADATVALSYTCENTN
jgi:hypothetical protein